MSQSTNQRTGEQSPSIIQGGMGVGVSSWQLARAVATQGEIGVVSGTAIDSVIVRELQDGDPHDRRRWISQYPDEQFADEILDDFYVSGGIASDAQYERLDRHQFEPTVHSQKVLSLATYSEIKLAQQDHDGVIGLNLLSKLKRYSLPCLYGAMLAGVDAIFMGAGIPKEEAEQVPKLASGQPAFLSLNVDTSRYEGDDPDTKYHFDPADILQPPPELDQPDFYPIIASDVLAKILDHKLDSDHITGWIIEKPVAGGHNAPPRGKQTDDHGDPVYDEKDEVDLDRVRDLGYPFYLAGGWDQPELLDKAIDMGAEGVQVGSLFSLAEESGYPEETKQKIIRRIHDGEITVRTDGRASPTGFPFKVLEMDGTLSDPDVYSGRQRICDLGYLQEPYMDADGNIKGRCAAEPVRAYESKGGDPEDTKGRQCLCNALMSNIGLEQRQDWGDEPELFTGGDSIKELPLGSKEQPTYSASDVIEYLRGS